MMEDRFSLIDHLVSKPVANASFRPVYMILAFSLSPLSVHLAKALQLGGLIPFLILVIFISLFLYYLLTVIISACFSSRAATYEEVLNNYFHRMDRPIGLLILVYCLLLMSLYQMTFTLTINTLYLYWLPNTLTDYPKILIGSTILIVNIIIISLSRFRNYKRFHKLCLIAVITWVIFLLSMLSLTIYNWRSLERILHKNEYYFNWNFPHSIYIIIVILNCTQSATLVYTDMIESNFAANKNEVTRSIKKSAIISIAFYIVFSLLLSVNKINEAGSKGFNNKIFLTERILTLVLLLLQISLTVFAARSTFVKTFMSHSFELGELSSFFISLFLVFLSASSNFLLFRSGKNDAPKKLGDYNNYTDFNDFYLVTALFSIFAGICVPWMLMIRTESYDAKRIGIGFVLGSLVIFSFIMTVYTGNLKEYKFQFLNS